MTSKWILAFHSWDTLSFQPETNKSLEPLKVENQGSWLVVLHAITLEEDTGEAHSVYRLDGHVLIQQPISEDSEGELCMY